MNVAVRLIELRKQKGYSTNKLAKLAGIGQSTLREIEIGEKQPTVYTIDRICSVLGITLAEFFSNDSAPEIPPEVRQIVNKVIKLPHDKIKILNDVLDTWVESD